MYLGYRTSIQCRLVENPVYKVNYFKSHSGSIIPINKIDSFHLSTYLRLHIVLGNFPVVSICIADI